MWLQWACHDNEAGDAFRFQVGEGIVTAKIPGTRTWDNYEARKFGHIELAAGRHRAVFQAALPLRQYLIDLLEVRLVPADHVDAPSFPPTGTESFPKR